MDQGEPPELHQDTGQTLPAPACLRPAPCSASPPAPEEGAGRPTSGGDHHGGDSPGPPYHQAPVVSRPLPSRILQGRLPLLLYRHPRPWVQRLPPRRHRHCRPAVGNRRPSAPTPTPMPITGTAASATGPSAGSGSGVGTGQQQSAPSMVPDILSYGAAAALEPRWPVASPSPPCDNQLPSPRCYSHRCLASRRGRLPLGPPPDAGAPGTRRPSSGPWSGIRKWSHKPPY